MYATKQDLKFSYNIILAANSIKSAWFDHDSWDFLLLRWRTHSDSNAGNREAGLRWTLSATVKCALKFTSSLDMSSSESKTLKQPGLRLPLSDIVGCWLCVTREWLLCFGISLPGDASSLFRFLLRPCDPILFVWRFNKLTYYRGRAEQFQFTFKAVHSLQHSCTCSWTATPTRRRLTAPAAARISQYFLDAGHASSWREATGDKTSQNTSFLDDREPRNKSPKFFNGYRRVLYNSYIHQWYTVRNQQQYKTNRKVNNATRTSMPQFTKEATPEARNTFILTLDRQQARR